MLLKAAVEPPAKLTGEHGEVLEDVGNAFMDDDATTTSNMEGTVKVLEVSSDFFELMNGKLNMLKTNVSILEYDQAGSLKRKCPEGVQWHADKNILSVVKVVNKVTAAALKDLELKERKAALLPEELKMISMVRIQMERDLLMKAESFEVNVLGPYEEVKYLGVWIQPAMFVQRAIEAATQQAVRIAGATHGLGLHETVGSDYGVEVHCYTAGELLSQDNAGWTERYRGCGPAVPSRSAR